MQDAREVLGRLIGSWKGTVDTWLEPQGPPVTSGIAGSFRKLLDGRSVLYEYSSSVGDRRSDGLAVIGRDLADDRIRMAWVDTFHTTSDLMVMAGEPIPSNQLLLEGAYSTAGEQWRWAITFECQGSDGLLIQHVNILPDGRRALAIDIKYERATDQTKN